MAYLIFFAFLLLLAVPPSLAVFDPDKALKRRLLSSQYKPDELPQIPLNMTFQLVVQNIEELNILEATAKLNVFQRLSWQDP